jgi:hypothetical protein
VKNTSFSDLSMLNRCYARVYYLIIFRSFVPGHGHRSSRLVVASVIPTLTVL